MEIGQLGHLGVIVAFLAALYGIFSLSLSAAPGSEGEGYIRRAGLLAFGLHTAGVLLVVVSLFTIIYTHRFEYHYAWSHSSRQLPVHYMISCFWEGQEGSFLLWIFWHVVIGFFLLNISVKWQKPVWMVFFAVQAFLVSMLLGAVIPGLEWKIGSSPFVLLREVQPDAPVFAINPGYIPEDGRGLNPLLQNYWMVIHPPTLFLGFALTLVPFCYALAALFTREYTAWVKPALTWTALASGVLGVGIAMGAYWAYETLNFGGYWNWDPVENAVYIPWLILVAALHMLMLYQSRKTGLGLAFILCLGSFVLVLYATFLTRSGILGNASVHSFTDLGLSGQLLLYLLAFLLLGTVMLLIRWKEIPKSAREIALYSREFWISAGVLVLFLASFQVLASTSIPVYNALGRVFGAELNLAPPTDPLLHYTVWQMAFFIAIALLTGIGQFFFWRDEGLRGTLSRLSLPLNLGLVVAIALILWTGVWEWKYILLLAAAMFSVAANGQMLIRTLRQNPGLSGGAIAHIGVGLILIGILYSSGYSRVVSLNNTGKVYRQDFSTEMNRDNVLLWRHDKVKTGAFTVSYLGPRVELKSGEYAPGDAVVPSGTEPDLGFVLDSFRVDGGWKKPGDSVRYYAENTYYELSFRDSAGREFRLFPRAQVNPNMGLIASPDIRRFFSFDLYTHVSSIPSPEEEIAYSEPVSRVLHLGDTFFVGDQVAVLENVGRVSDRVMANLGMVQAAVEARIRILGPEGRVFYARPVFMIRNQEVGILPDVVEDAGARLALTHIDPAQQTFTVAAETSRKDWIILKAMEKPGINVLWMGILVMTAGFGISFRRRLGK
jgi:cytochrome c-type biogenesis protein CcmF